MKEFLIMIDISASELNKYYGANHVLKGITFSINSGEKIGLLGRNGSGKTTLFKTITEEEPYESGNLSKASGKKIEILAQIPIFEENDTVEDILFSSFKEVLDIHEAMKKIEGDSNPAVLKRYGKLMEEYERLGGYEVEVNIEKICNGMSISENMRKSLFSLLSGGEKTRVNLARILLRDCDILLLDEPTNHLDLTSLEWLEKFLLNFPGTVVVISHDRAFLDRVVTRIIEIDEGKANFYAGNYSFYVEEREQRYLTQAEQYKQQQRKISLLEVAIKRQRVWVQSNPLNTGLAKRALAMEKRLEQMDKVERPNTSKRIDEDFNSGGYAAKVIVKFDSVHKQFGSKVLLNNLNLSIFRNDSIALIGENGCGKSTLIKLITGEEACDSGIVTVSSNVRIAYMPQMITFENESATVLETLRSSFGLAEEKARSILAGFKFKAADVMKKVGNLSGGEKSRLKLCLLMQNQVNFLILDEPTNHLDIESREWIEDAVSDFDGTMLFISHDRYFLNKFTSKIWSMKDGTITEFNCGLDEYLIKTTANAKESSAIPTDKKAKLPPTKKAEPLPKALSVEALINVAEIELQKVNSAIELDLLSSDFKKMKILYEEKLHLEEKIRLLYSEWAKEN
jgi:ATPase subunit of ABC transporter with duplicated ATPase domains